MATDFYETLGVERGASPKEIQSAYRRLARRYHPDVNGGDAEAEQRFKEVNAAHDVLGDDRKRAAYDKWGDRWEHAEQLEEMERNGAFGFQQRGGGGFADFGRRPGAGSYTFTQSDLGDLGDLGDIFGGLFNFGGREAVPSRGRDIEHPVTISLAEAFHGATRTIQAPQALRAAGAGEGPRFSRLEVTIPPGVDTGRRVKISGKGAAGPGGVGDLYLMITVQDDPRFERKGDNLYTDIELPISTAALGGEISVPTITGRVELRIPQGTQNGRAFRLAGQGMPRRRSGKTDKSGPRGDLFARARLRLPEPLTPEHLALFRELRALEQTDGSDD